VGFIETDAQLRTACAASLTACASIKAYSYKATLLKKGGPRGTR
jgi:hypothetical protein